MYKLLIIVGSVAMLSGNATTKQNEFQPDLNQLAPVVLFSEEQHACLAKTIYWEGRNQSIAGMAAIGHVVMNRVASPDFPNTACDVVHQGGAEQRHRCQFSYYCDGKSDQPNLDNALELQAWDWANLIAELILIGEMQDITHGSTFYHATYVEPDWSEKFIQVAAYGDHVFYVN